MVIAPFHLELDLVSSSLRPGCQMCSGPGNLPASETQLLWVLKLKQLTVFYLRLRTSSTPFLK